MGKFNDLEENEKRKIEDELEAKSTALGLDSYDAYTTSSEISYLKDLVGICSDCKSLQFCKTEFGNVRAICSHFEFRLTGQNRIAECNCHSPKGVLSLNEMYSMAYLIDLNEPAVKGFISTDPKLMKKKTDPKLMKKKTDPKLMKKRNRKIQITRSI